MNLNKLLSGKFIFSVTTAVAFLYATVNKILSPEQVNAIIMIIVVFYFNKKKDSKNEN